MRISDWSSDVCSSNLLAQALNRHPTGAVNAGHAQDDRCARDGVFGLPCLQCTFGIEPPPAPLALWVQRRIFIDPVAAEFAVHRSSHAIDDALAPPALRRTPAPPAHLGPAADRGRRTPD